MEQTTLSYTATTTTSQSDQEVDPAAEASLFSLVYSGELDSSSLQRAVENRSIPRTAKDQWHCSGIRKLLNGSLDFSSKNDLEKATAISRKISRFMVEQPESFAELPSAAQSKLLSLHAATGSRAWVDDDEQLIVSKIQANSDLIADFGMDFSATPAEELAQNLTSDEVLHFSWIECGHREFRSADSINTAINKKKAPHCKECRKLDNSFIAWYYANEDFLLDTELDISRLSNEELLASAYSKVKINIGYGCGHREDTTFQSLKDKLKRAQDLGQPTISCNGCKVADGTFEVGIRMAIQLSVTFVPGVTIEKQVEIDGLKGKPYDMVIRLASGKLYFVEVDGGHHYKPFNRKGHDAFLRKVEVDKIKTEAVLERGHGLIRIDERNHKGEMTDELSEVLSGALRGILSAYTVVGEECPGAKQVSAELKGWA